MVERLGFVGFGEAAFHLAKGLREAGVKRTLAFDIHMHTPRLGEKIQARAQETGTDLVEFSAALAAGSDVIISAVTADQAVDAAEQTTPYLTPRHIYADLNSVSPRTKQRVGEIVSHGGGRFVEIAVMGPIPPQLHKTPMLIGGAAAPEFQKMFAPYGMRMDVVSTGQIGRAAAVKMFRSVIYKGLEALIFECVLGASQYGAEDRVFASLAESFPGIDWKKLADYMVGRVVVHGERRAREMDEVARTLEELGIEPMMAAATARRMDWAADLGLRETFGGEFPKTYQEVLDAISETRRHEGMMVYLWIAFGSALGGVARYACQGWAARFISDTFPWGTMIVNIVGCSFIGFFYTLTSPDGRVIVSPTMRQFVMVGICGGYTTFSSFSLDALIKVRDGEWAQAAGYVFGSLVFCLLGVWLGHTAAVAANGR